MTKSVRLIILLASASPFAFSNVVVGPNVGTFTTFIDTNTGYEWLTLNDTYGLDYPTQLSVLPAGFQVATFNDVNSMATSNMPNPSANFAYYNSVLMGSTYRGLLWGNYADTSGSGSPNAWYYAYSFDSFWSNYNPSDSSAYSDLGLWAFNSSTSNSSATPEPGTALLFLGSGILFFVRRRR